MDAKLPDDELGPVGVYLPLREGEAEYTVRERRGAFAETYIRARGINKAPNESPLMFLREGFDLRCEHSEVVCEVFGEPGSTGAEAQPVLKAFST